MTKVSQKFPYPLRTITHECKVWEYIATGKGKTFVILPGGGESAESTFRLIRSLENTYRVIVPTIYDVDSMSEFTSVLNALLNKEKANTIILYGLSLGGLLAQVYARDHKKKVEALIISHACTPRSKTYQRKNLLPLRLLQKFLPCIPNRLIQFAVRFAGVVQGENPKISKKYPVNLSRKDKEYYKVIMDEYYRRFFDKRLLQTWIGLHHEFSKQELLPENYSYLKGKVLILRTDNDPLMQDEGDFKRLYPTAKVHTFKDTGHLTFYYQLESMAEVIKQFLQKSRYYAHR